MSDKVLDRLQKLIALSTSPEVEEARTSALLACQLIIEHRLIVVRHERSKPIEKDPPSQKPSDVHPYPSTAHPWNTPPWARPHPPPPPRPPPQSKPVRPLRIVIMCESYCAVCGGKVHLAEEAWLRGKDVIHLGCLK